MPKIVDHAARRREFAEAALRIIAREGFEGMSMRGVAAESGLSYGSLFHYFDSKDDLLLEAVRLIMTAQTDRMNRITDAHAGLEALVELMCDDAVVDSDSRRHWMAWNAFLYKASFNEDFARYHDAQIEGWLERIAALLESAKAAGELESGIDIADEALALSAFAAGIGQQGLLNPQSCPPERQRSLITAYVRRLASGRVGHPYSERR